MKRLKEDDCNNPTWFDSIWAIEGLHHYDSVRLRAFLVEMDEGKTLLDVGAGWMGVAQFAVTHGVPGRYIAIDFSVVARQRTIEMAPTLDYRIGDATTLPFPDESFDRVACGELIEHFHDPTRLVNELVRVCKPGGRIIISTLDANCEAAIKHGEYKEHLVSWDTPNEVAEYFKPFGECRAWVLGHYFMVDCHKYRRNS